MERKTKIPDGIEAEINDNEVIIKKNGEQLREKFQLGKINLEKKENHVKIQVDNPRRKEKALAGTIQGKIQNMIKGLQEGYEYKLRAIYKHFPMNINVEGNKVKIQNFAGEKEPRYSKVKEDTEVEVKGEEIIVKGRNKADAGQTAANLEQATWIKNKDPRVFEDGIYIIEKPE